MTTIRYPNIRVKLVGEDGNAFAIMGRVAQAMRKAGLGDDEVKRYQKEAMSGSYADLLAITCRWVDVQ